MRQHSQKLANNTSIYQASNLITISVFKLTEIRYDTHFHKTIDRVRSILLHPWSLSYGNVWELSFWCMHAYHNLIVDWIVTKCITEIQFTALEFSLRFLTEVELVWVVNIRESWVCVERGSTGKRQALQLKPILGSWGEIVRAESHGWSCSLPS